jgi:NitT/TauT family transport system ATP-binding protein
MLKISSLSKKFIIQGGSIEVIRKIDCEIKDSNFVVFVGPSGCGKSTLLKCVAGLIEPTCGSTILNGGKIISPSKKIGMVFQNFSLFPWCTVKENIEFGLRINNSLGKERDSIVSHFMKITGLEEFKDFYPKNISGGMQQRVAIARTLANNPEVILMDEPFGSLDSLTRSKMQMFLVDLWEKEKKTIIFVTHDIEEAIFLADEIIVLSKRPAIIKNIFKINFPRPRINELKQTREFLDLRNKIAQTLGESQ